MVPIPFDPINGPKLMCLLGFELSRHPESWEDVGGPESGPHIVGGPAYDQWTQGSFAIIVVDGQVVDTLSGHEASGEF